MQAFEWANAKSVQNAVELLGPPATDFDETARPIGGGQDLHTTMKAYISRPGRVVNLKTIPLLNSIGTDRAKLLTGVHQNVLQIGATATLTEIADHPDINKMIPGLIEAVHSIATPQIRNVGTIGGNLGQRPRCWYFRLEDVKCLKRGGDTCYAKEGENKYNAIFGTDAPCVVTHPSDLAPMLVALDAIIELMSDHFTREVKAADFFRMPTVDDPKRETVLKDGEIITSVRFVTTPMTARSTYLKFKERSSLDFAMASVAAAADIGDDKTVKSARVVLGGVAPIPWALPAVDAFLAGKTLDEATIAKAAEMAIDGAKPLSQNGYKLPLIKTLVRRALAKLA